MRGALRNKFSIVFFLAKYNFRESNLDANRPYYVVDEESMVKGISIGALIGLNWNPISRFHVR